MKAFFYRVAATTALFVLAAPAAQAHSSEVSQSSAGASAFNTRMPFSFTTAGCQEPITFSGAIRVRAGASQDSSGGLHYRLSILPQNFKAVGQETGANYRVRPNITYSLTPSDQGLPAITTNLDFRLDGPKAGDGLRVTAKASMSSGERGLPAFKLGEPKAICR